MVPDTQTAEQAIQRAAEHLAYWYGENDRRGFGQTTEAAEEVFKAKEALTQTIRTALALSAAEGRYDGANDAAREWRQDRNPQSVVEKAWAEVVRLRGELGL